MTPATEPLPVATATLATPIGPLHLYGTDAGLLALVLPNEAAGDAEERLRRRIGPLRLYADERHHAAALGQLADYFAGRPVEFDLALDVRGTPFQRAVWAAVAAVPYGETRSYGEIARRIGQPAAVRAVGLANGANPLPLVIPCHRVVGSDGKLTGYSGGRPTKRYLLALERGGQLDPPAAAPPAIAQAALWPG